MKASAELGSAIDNAEQGQAEISVTQRDGTAIASIELVTEPQRGSLAERLIYARVAGAACERALQVVYSGAQLRLLEEKIILLSEQGGALLRAVAREFHSDGGQVIWRALVYRSFRGHEAEACVAEITQRWSAVLVGQQKPTSVATLEILPAQEDRPSSGSAVRGSEERREKILKAAYEVISQRGYANSSMREIAQAAKVPIATVYLYIKSKEDLLFQISAVLLGDMKEQFRSEIQVHVSPREALAEAIKRYVHYCGVNRRFINLVYREGKSLSDSNRKKIFELDRSFVKLWEAIIVAGKEAGQFEVKSPELAANFIYFLCTIWSLRYWNLRAFSEETICDSIILFAMRALGATSVVQKNRGKDRNR